MFLAERRAAERLAEQRRLQDYAKRFAFVAHDVKTVSSQLSLLLANAEDNMQDPEFQRDMLPTVRASADRINTLIARLRQPGEVMPSAGAPPARRRPCGPPSDRSCVQRRRGTGTGAQRRIAAAMPPRPGGQRRPHRRRCHGPAAMARGALRRRLRRIC